MDGVEQFLFRWTFTILCGAVYLTCRYSGYGNLKLNKTIGKLRIYRSDSRVIFLARLFKVVVLLMDKLNPFGAIYYTIFFSGKLLPSCHNALERLLIYSTLLVNNIYFLRIFYVFHSRKYSEDCLLVIQNLMDIHRSIKSSCIGCEFRMEICIFAIFLLQYKMTALQFFLSLFQPWIYAYNLVLFEIFFCAYFIYQMILLAWLRILCDRLSDWSFYSQHCRRQLMQFYSLYVRINSVHRLVSQLWLQISDLLYINIFKSTMDFVFVLNEFMTPKYHMGTFDKILKICCCLAPIMRIYLVVLCNERIVKLNQRMSEELYRMELLEPRMDISVDKFLKIEHCCFHQMQQLYPMRNHIWNKQQVFNFRILFTFLCCLIFNAIIIMKHPIQCAEHL